MAETTAQSRIAEYVQTLDNSIPEDDVMEFAINEVIDRVLVYTNRYKDVDEQNPDTYTPDILPPKLERIIARAVVSVYHNTTQVLGKDDTMEIKSITDNGQSVTFGDKVKSYLVTATDEEVLSAIVPLLDKFRVPTIVENPPEF